MFKKNMFLALVLLFVGVTIYYLTVIKAPKNDIPNDIPSIKITKIGTISEIEAKGDFGTIFIEQDVYKAYVTIDEKAIITDSKNTKGLTFDDLKIGDRVEVLVPEIIIEIYPYQYATERVVILD